MKHKRKYIKIAQHDPAGWIFIPFLFFDLSGPKKFNKAYFCEMKRAEAKLIKKFQPPLNFIDTKKAAKAKRNTTKRKDKNHECIACIIELYGM